MSSRSWTLFLGDMREAAARVVAYTSGMERNAYFNNALVQDATVRNLFVLGEASKAVPAEIRNAHPEIDWRGISGLRNILAHAYFAVNEATLWEIIREKVPVLVTQLDVLAAELDTTSRGPE